MLDEKYTVLIVTHQLNNLKDCDQIFYLAGGKIKLQGTFDALSQHEDLFSNDS